MTKAKTVLGIVFISGGSSWATAELTDKVTLEVIASRAAKNTKRSWKHLFKFRPENPGYARVSNCTVSRPSLSHYYHQELIGVVHPSSQFQSKTLTINQVEA